MGTFSQEPFRFRDRDLLSKWPRSLRQYKPPSRVYNRELVKQAPAGSSLVQRLEFHARQRSEATAEVLMGVGLLRSRGRVYKTDAVAYTGAVWQDMAESGNPFEQRSHRVPCNPTIGYKNIPDHTLSPRLRYELTIPLAVTDPLPIIANYADKRFEDLGGKEALARAVREIVQHQEQGRPVDYDLYVHALRIVLGDYAKAFRERVIPDVEMKVEREGAESLREQMERYKPSAPTTSPDMLLDVVHQYAMVAQPQAPVLEKRPMFEQYVAKLQTLDR
jgi:hypothetical protein